LRQSERGQITVMTIGFFLVIALLGVVVVDASHVFLERRELDNLADGAALVAADALDEDAFYTTGAVVADSRSVRRRVAQYVTGSGSRVVAVRMTGDHITVRLERTMDLALTPPGFPAQATIASEASSQLRSGG